MSEEQNKRKKYSLYLRPDNETDQQVMDIIESINRMGRGEVFRNAFVTGLAMYKLDNRLPALISTLFKGQISADQIVGLISQTTDWKPSQADIRAILSELGRGEVTVPPVVSPEDEDKQAMDAARKKLAGMI
ncbi:plasmid partitioning/stability family protein [Salmonella enterica]|uniref:plasmid partitioning/stability family protein n=1 Tax=Salmonella enterica TaxID=28901 RepID=UPI001FFAD3D2|nr:plasmid partitioning/stability family protein [Salmonella enterica]